MGMPVSERSETFLPHIPDHGQLFPGVKGKVLRRGIRIAQQIDLFHVPDSVFLRSAEESARLIRQFLQGMIDQFPRVCRTKSYPCVRIQVFSPFRSHEGCS